MEVVEKDFQAFEQLLRLVNISVLGAPLCYCYDGENNNEKQLKPSYSHLSKLIDYVSNKGHSDKPENNINRKELYSGDTNALKRAHDELEENYASLSASSKEWYIFEGFTNPDIFIEGDDYIIVCEGKWTEPNITTHTTHLPCRSQMVRHIQGALNYSDKKVCAFYIVDSEFGKEYLKNLTKDALEKQLSQETIKLENEEVKKILDAFYGYTTWQDIHEAIPSVRFKSKNEIE